MPKSSQKDRAGDTPPPPPGDNSAGRYDTIKADWFRILEIDEEIKTLGEERSKLVKGLEKNQGVSRGALAEIKRLNTLNPATVEKREESRAELYDLIIAPKVRAAKENAADEQ